MGWSFDFLEYRLKIVLAVCALARARRAARGSDLRRAILDMDRAIRWLERGIAGLRRYRLRLPFKPCPDQAVNPSIGDLRSILAEWCRLRRLARTRRADGLLHHPVLDARLCPYLPWLDAVKKPLPKAE